MRVLVTGQHGSIGSVRVPPLAANGAEIVGLHRARPRLAPDLRWRWSAAMALPA